MARDTATEIPSAPDLELVFRFLERGTQVDDAFFDRVYPQWIRDRSRIHWTPLPVVQRAVALLTREREENRVLDVGSGAGKFCLAGSVCSRARFTGIEQRAHLVELSRKIAQRYRIPRVNFVHGNLLDLDWKKFNAIYLYNPFEEQRTPYRRIDSTLELCASRFVEYVRITETQLARMPDGVRVVTYHGFGGKMPLGYQRKLSEWCFRGPLELWEK